MVRGRIAQVGHPDEVARDHGGLRSVDGKGRIALPGLIDCHTHPAFGGNRANEFDLRAQGADYERIHAEGGGIRATVAATRALGEAGLQAVVTRHFGWMRRHGTTTAEGKSGYGLDHDTELASLAARSPPTTPIETVPTFLGAHTCRRSSATATPTSISSSPRCCRRPLSSPRRPTYSSSAGAFSADAGRSLPARRRRATAWRCGCTATSSARPGAIPLAVELGARSVDHLEATGPDGVVQLAESDVAAVLLPVAALYLRRSMPPARALIDAGRDRGARDRLQPGQRVLRFAADGDEPRLHRARHDAGRGARRDCTVNAAWVLGRSDRLGRLAPGYDADMLLLDAPDWRYIVYHLAGADIAAVIKRGRLV